MTGASGLIALLAYAGSHKHIAESFVYTKTPFLLGVLEGSVALFQNDPVPGLMYMQIAVLCGLAAVTLNTLYKQVPPDQHWEVTLLRKMAASLSMAIPAFGYIILFRLDPGYWGWLLGMFLSPLFALFCAVLFFETANPITALTRTFRIMPWSQAIVAGILIVNLTILLYMFLDSIIWSMILQLFSWMVPSGSGNLQTFTTFANIITGSLVGYFSFTLQTLCGGFLYFTGREISDATSLRDGIERIGAARKIRGLARE
jgi:hypothetical protein